MVDVKSLEFNHETGNYEDLSGNFYTVSELSRELYSRELLEEMLNVRSAAYRATEAGTLLPAKRDAIERTIGHARQQLMPADLFTAILAAFRREIETARDTWTPSPPIHAADISA